MNKHTKELVGKALDKAVPYTWDSLDYHEMEKLLETFAELVVESVLDKVKERAYYTGDRDWSDEVDRTWIQLEFGYGKLHDAKTSGN